MAAPIWWECCTAASATMPRPHPSGAAWSCTLATTSTGVPDSRGVLDSVANGPGAGFDTLHLKGNHEDLLLRFLDDPGLADVWLANGGDATLASYGVDVSPWDTPTRVRDRFAAALPVQHRRFFSALRLHATIGDYFFVHAGVRPGIALDAQQTDDMLWIRDEFLRSGDDFGKVVVHGHTPGPRVAFERNRIGVDTMAWYSGRLSCLVLYGTTQRVMQA